LHRYVVSRLNNQIFLNILYFAHNSEVGCIFWKYKFDINKGRGVIRKNEFKLNGRGVLILTALPN